VPIKPTLSDGNDSSLCRHNVDEFDLSVNIEYVGCWELVRPVGDHVARSIEGVYAERCGE
jgi:hypothetical protein